MVPERRDERPGWASTDEDTSPRARRLPGLVKRSPRKSRRVCRARHTPSRDRPRVIIQARRATLRGVIILPGARRRGGGPRHRSARARRRRAPPARRGRPRAPPAVACRGPALQHPIALQQLQPEVGRRRRAPDAGPSASRRRRSASSGPNRPSGSVSSARASAIRPASVRASTAANRPATSIDTAPPGAAARASARTAAGTSSTTSSSPWPSTRSARPSGATSASVSTSPGTAVTSSSTPASRARRRSAASALGLGSTTETAHPALASGTAQAPLPPPTSSTRGRTPGRAVADRRELGRDGAVHGAAVAAGAPGGLRRCSSPEPPRRSSNRRHARSLVRRQRTGLGTRTVG